MKLTQWIFELTGQRYSSVQIKEVVSEQREDPRDAVIELVANAADSMPGGGEITVRLQADGFCVRDRGTGIAREQLSALLVPNISRKPDGAVGYFGVGFLSVLQLLQHPGDMIEVVTYTAATEPGLRIQLSEVDGEYYLAIEEIDNPDARVGTDIIANLNHFDDNYARASLAQTFRRFTRSSITLQPDNVRINPPKEPYYSYPGTDHLISVDCYDDFSGLELIVAGVNVVLEPMQADANATGVVLNFDNKLPLIGKGRSDVPVDRVVDALIAMVTDYAGDRFFAFANAVAHYLASVEKKFSRDVAGPFTVLKNRLAIACVDRKVISSNKLYRPLECLEGGRVVRLDPSLISSRWLLNIGVQKNIDGIDWLTYVVPYRYGKQPVIIDPRNNVLVISEAYYLSMRSKHIDMTIMLKNVLRYVTADKMIAQKNPLLGNESTEEGVIESKGTDSDLPLRDVHEVELVAAEAGPTQTEAEGMAADSDDMKLLSRVKAHSCRDGSSIEFPVGSDPSDFEIWAREHPLYQGMTREVWQAMLPDERQQLVVLEKAIDHTEVQTFVENFLKYNPSEMIISGETYYVDQVYTRDGGCEDVFMDKHCSLLVGETAAMVEAAYSYHKLRDSFVVEMDRELKRCDSVIHAYFNRRSNKTQVVDVHGEVIERLAGEFHVVAVTDDLYILGHLVGAYGTCCEFSEPPVLKRASNPVFEYEFERNTVVYNVFNPTIFAEGKDALVGLDKMMAHTHYQLDLDTGTRHPLPKHLPVPRFDFCCIAITSRYYIYQNVGSFFDNDEGSVFAGECLAFYSVDESVCATVLPVLGGAARNPQQIQLMSDTELMIESAGCAVYSGIHERSRSMYHAFEMGSKAVRGGERLRYEQLCDALSADVAKREPLGAEGFHYYCGYYMPLASRDDRWEVFPFTSEKAVSSKRIEFKKMAERLAADDAVSEEAKADHSLLSSVSAEQQMLAFELDKMARFIDREMMLAGEARSDSERAEAITLSMDLPIDLKLIGEMFDESTVMALGNPVTQLTSDHKARYVLMSVDSKGNYVIDQSTGRWYLLDDIEPFVVGELGLYAKGQCYQLLDSGEFQCCLPFIPSRSGELRYPAYSSYVDLILNSHKGPGFRHNLAQVASGKVTKVSLDELSPEIFRLLSFGKFSIQTLQVLNDLLNTEELNGIANGEYLMWAQALCEKIPDVHPDHYKRYFLFFYRMQMAGFSGEILLRKVELVAASPSSMAVLYNIACDSKKLLSRLGAGDVLEQTDFIESLNEEYADLAVFMLSSMLLPLKQASHRALDAEFVDEDVSLLSGAAEGVTDDGLSMTAFRRRLRSKVVSSIDPMQPAYLLQQLRWLRNNAVTSFDYRLFFDAESRFVTQYHVEAGSATVSGVLASLVHAESMYEGVPLLALCYQACSVVLTFHCQDSHQRAWLELAVKDFDSMGMDIQYRLRMADLAEGELPMRGIMVQRTSAEAGLMQSIVFQRALNTLVTVLDATDLAVSCEGMLWNAPVNVFAAERGISILKAKSSGVAANDVFVAAKWPSCWTEHLPKPLLTCLQRLGVVVNLTSEVTLSASGDAVIAPANYSDDVLRLLMKSAITLFETDVALPIFFPKDVLSEYASNKYDQKELSALASEWLAWLDAGAAMPRPSGRMNIDVFKWMILQRPLSGITDEAGNPLSVENIALHAEPDVIIECVSGQKTCPRLVKMWLDDWRRSLQHQSEQSAVLEKYGLSASDEWMAPCYTDKGVYWRLFEDLIQHFLQALLPDRPVALGYSVVRLDAFAMADFSRQSICFNPLHCADKVRALGDAIIASDQLAFAKIYTKVMVTVAHEAAHLAGFSSHDDDFLEQEISYINDLVARLMPENDFYSLVTLYRALLLPYSASKLTCADALYRVFLADQVCEEAQPIVAKDEARVALRDRAYKQVAIHMADRIWREGVQAAKEQGAATVIASSFRRHQAASLFRRQRCAASVMASTVRGHQMRVREHGAATMLSSLFKGYRVRRADIFALKDHLNALLQQVRRLIDVYSGRVVEGAPLILRDNFWRVYNLMKFLQNLHAALNRGAPLTSLQTQRVESSLVYAINKLFETLTQWSTSSHRPTTLYWVLHEIPEDDGRSIRQALRDICFQCAEASDGSSPLLYSGEPELPAEVSTAFVYFERYCNQALLLASNKASGEAARMGFTKDWG